LAVVAILMLVMALALPNFAGMIRSQKWASASSALQNCLFRTQSFALNDRYDYSIEFCESDQGLQYFRIEAESALLESMPELTSYNQVQCNGYYMWMPNDWMAAFEAGGGKVEGLPTSPWMRSDSTVFRYNGPIYDIDRGNWRSTHWIKDNLKVDDHIFLPQGIKVELEKSKNLINYDKRPHIMMDTPQYGWDDTRDLRFNIAGVLIQAKNPDVVLANSLTPPEYLRLQVLRSTARVRKLSGLP
jgi:hypothetical protein